jgi:adenosylcobinamide kinase/adenosylcobinamide-phosphate guanylyltransferase
MEKGERRNGMKITFIIGGSRSGKSSFALQEATRLSGRKAFIATAEGLDDEMRMRIEKHRIERGSDWDTFEEPLAVSGLLGTVTDTHQAVVLDCLTIWLSNLLVRVQLPEKKVQTAEESVEEFVDTLIRLKGRQQRRLFIVTNEVGMGIVPDNKLARQFRDLAGTLHQRLAGIADEVYSVTAGIPVKIKG